MEYVPGTRIYTTHTNGFCQRDFDELTRANREALRDARIMMLDELDMAEHTLSITAGCELFEDNE